MTLSGAGIVNSRGHVHPVPPVGCAQHKRVVKGVDSKFLEVTMLEPQTLFLYPVDPTISADKTVDVPSGPAAGNRVVTVLVHSKQAYSTIGKLEMAWINPKLA